MRSAVASGEGGGGYLEITADFSRREGTLTYLVKWGIWRGKGEFPSTGKTTWVKPVNPQQLPTVPCDESRAQTHTHTHNPNRTHVHQLN